MATSTTRRALGSLRDRNFDGTAFHQHIARARRREHQIGGCELVGETVELDRAPSDPPGEIVAVPSVRFATQMSATPRLASATAIRRPSRRTDDEHVAALETAEMLAGDRDGRRRDRYRVATDLRLGADALATLDRVTEDTAEQIPAVDSFSAASHALRT